MTGEEFAKYLSNLLIVQYRKGQRNLACLKALGGVFPVDLMQAVRDGYDLETAQGEQLDVLAKYLFQYEDGSQARFFANDNNETERLGDDDFRTLLKFKIICNNSDYSNKSIDDALTDMFGDKIKADSTGGMAMTYYIGTGVKDFIRALLYHNTLPRPLGVSFDVIIRGSTFFGLCTYENQTAFVRTGVSTYETQDTKQGQMFTYEKTYEVS